MNAWINWVSLLSGLLSLIAAIGFGVYAIRQSRDQSSQLTENLGKSTQILSHLTTRHIGEFPNYLPNIFACLDDADSEILIACDYPGYAVVTDYAWCIRYLSLLNAKHAQGVTVAIVVQEEDRRTVPAERQFGSTEEQWKTLMADPDFFARVTLVATREGISIANLNDFHRRLKELQQQIWLDRLQALPDRRVFGGMMPLFCWISDRRRAVFSIPTIKDGQSSPFLEHAFESRDERLIGALVSIFFGYQHASQCVARKKEAAPSAVQAESATSVAS